MPIQPRAEIRLIDAVTRDGRSLEGLLYEPRDEDATAAVLHLHGKGGNFYSGPPRFIPERAGTAPVRHLSLNMRCHDLAYTRSDVTGVDFHRGSPVLADGGSWENLSTGTHDVRAGIDVLRALGPQPIFIVGHSSGGFYTAIYGAKDADIAGRVLLSPLISNKRPLEMWFGGAEGVEAALADARRMVAEGDGDLLIPLPSWYYAISAASLVERAMEPDGTWLEAIAASDAPLLMLWGTLESRAEEWKSTFAGLPTTVKHAAIIEGADHNYIGFEDEVARAVVDFISR